MKTKLRSTGNDIHPLHPVAGFIVFIIIWHLVSLSGVVPRFALPTPWSVAKAFVESFPLLLRHSLTTVTEAFAGLFLGVLTAFLCAVVMDRFRLMLSLFYPLLVVSQTIPVIAIAPLLVLWLGYGYAPKVALVALVCFFPMTVGLLDAFGKTDKEAVNLLRSMGASSRQIFVHAKLPAAATSFFSGLKIAVSYSIVGAVIAEWLGGDAGLGVYMTRVRKSYAFDKMFAVIVLISLISLLLIGLVKYIERKATPWNVTESRDDEL